MTAKLLPYTPGLKERYVYMRIVYPDGFTVSRSFKTAGALIREVTAYQRRIR